jgi:uncharacterized phosphatase
MHAVFVRHAEPDASLLAAAGRRFSGARFDFCPLGEAGKEQARRLAASLAPLRPQLIVSSPYARTLQTALVLATVLSLDADVALDLHDWMPVTDGGRGYGSEDVAAAIRAFEATAGRGGAEAGRTWETWDDLKERVTRTVQQYLTLERVVFVTHEAVIAAVTGNTEIPPASAHHVLVREREGAIIFVPLSPPDPASWHDIS